MIDLVPLPVRPFTMCSGDRRSPEHYAVNLCGVRIGTVEKWSFAVFEPNVDRIRSRRLSWRAVNDRTVTIKVCKSQGEAIVSLVEAARRGRLSGIPWDTLGGG